MKKVVLAYSGGLDTSVCIPHLKEHYGCNYAIAVTVDLGQPAKEKEKAQKKGEKISQQHYTTGAKDKVVKDYIFPLIKANGSDDGYVLGTSIARPLFAKKVVK